MKHQRNSFVVHKIIIQTSIVIFASQRHKTHKALVYSYASDIAVRTQRGYIQAGSSVILHYLTIADWSRRQRTKEVSGSGKS